MEINTTITDVMYLPAIPLGGIRDNPVNHAVKVIDANMKQCEVLRGAVETSERLNRLFGAVPSGT